MLAGKHQPVWTVVQLRLVVDALPISVTICHIAHNTSFCFARILLVLFLLLCSHPWKAEEKKIDKMLLKVYHRRQATLPGVENRPTWRQTPVEQLAKLVQ
jgi:hypothetical protein